MTAAPNNAGDAERDQHGEGGFPVAFKWLAGVGASVLIALLPVNTVQAMRLESKTGAATAAAVQVGEQLGLLRADVARLDVTLRAFINEKNAEATMRIALLEQRLAALEKAPR